MTIARASGVNPREGGTDKKPRRAGRWSRFGSDRSAFTSILSATPSALLFWSFGSGALRIIESASRNQHVIRALDELNLALRDSAPPFDGLALVRDPHFAARSLRSQAVNHDLQFIVPPGKMGWRVFERIMLTWLIILPRRASHSNRRAAYGRSLPFAEEKHRATNVMKKKPAGGLCIRRPGIHSSSGCIRAGWSCPWRRCPRSFRCPRRRCSHRRSQSQRQEQLRGCRR